MLKIAYCDDDFAERERALGYLAKVQEKNDMRFEVSSFEDGEKLVAQLKKVHFDLIYLDYSMPGMSGLEVAKIVKEVTNGTTKMIFISSYDNYIRELFPLGVISFIDKPYKEEAFFKTFQFAYRELFNEKNRTFAYTVRGDKKFAFIRDIIYFETGEHSTILNLKDGTQAEFRSTISDVWREVKQYECFVMPTRSFIVNLKHASSVSSTMINVGNVCIAIGRTHKKDTDQRYIRFLETINDGGTV